MVLLEAMFYDIREAILVVWASFIVGVRFVLTNWTKEDTVSISKCSAYLLIGYISLLLLFLIGE
jgi:hypothetical protein